MVATEPLPEAPDAILGVIDLRGKIVPIIDLRTRLGLPTTELAPADRIVVTRAPSGSVGLRVDTVTRLAAVDSSEIEPLAIPNGGAAQLARAAVRLDGVLHYQLDLAALRADLGLD